MTTSLGQEIHQSRPFGSPEQEAFLSVVRTAAALADAMEQVVASEGLSLVQYNALRILRGAGALGLCRNELRDRMLTRMPDVTRLLDRMEEAGLVSRTRDEVDRRLVSTRITGRGKQLLDRLDPKVADEHRRRLGHMTEGELGRLVDLLSKAREAV